RDQLRVDGDDAVLRVGLGEGGRESVVELPVVRAPRRVLRHREAASPGLGPHRGGLLGRQEDLLLAARERGEHSARPGDGLAALPKPLRGLTEAPRRRLELRAADDGAGERHVQRPLEQARGATQPPAVLAERLERARVDDDGGFPVGFHGGGPSPRCVPRTEFDWETTSRPTGADGCGSGTCGGRPRWRMGGVPGRLSSGVSMSNGNTTVSPIPSSASSGRIASEYPATPNLAAEYAASPGQPCTAAVEARLTTWPPAARSHGSVVRIVLAVPTRSTRSTRSKSSGACAAQVPGPRIAAQLTRRSRRPLGATCCATTRSSAGRSATSATAVAIP